MRWATSASRAGAAPAAALLVALAAIAWSFVPGLPFTGADTWPILEQGARALREPGVVLREPYLDGSPIGGTFWRPFFVGAFALQWAAFGATPLPYHLVRLAAYVALALLVGALAGRRGRAPALAAFVAGAIVLLHPLQADMLPSVARSADVFGDVLLAATILGLSDARGGRVRRGLGLACALLAPGIKETGLVAPAIGVLLLEPWRSDAGRARRVGALLLAAGLALHGVARLAFLGSLGRYDPLGERSAGLLQNLALLARALSEQRSTVLAALVLALVALLPLLARAHAPEDETWRRVRRAAWAWLLLAALGALSSPRLAERHASALLAPAAVLLGAALGSRMCGWNSERPTRGRVAAAALVALLALVLLPRSPLWRRYSQWPVIGRASELLVDAADDAARALETSGSPSLVRFGAFQVAALRARERLVIEINPFPYFAAAPDGARSAALHQPVVLMSYSVAAALRLRGRAQPLEVRAGPGLAVGPAQLGPLQDPVTITIRR